MRIPDTLPATAGQAQDLAIEWSRWMHDNNLDYGDMAEWADFFERVADKFPELAKEFIENAII